MTGTPPALGLFGWGTLGGMAAAATMFLLPHVVRVAVTGEVYDNHRLRMSASGLAVLLLGVLAGIVALTLPDSADRGQAIVTGCTALGTLRGVVSTVREAVLASAVD